MKRKTVIIYATPVPECWGNLKLFCAEKGLKYNTYSRKKFPFEFNGFMVFRIEFKSGSVKLLKRTNSIDND